MHTRLIKTAALVLMITLLLTAFPMAYADSGSMLLTGLKPLDQIMYVRTGNSGGLNLRQGPSTMSASLGLYPNGTQVDIRGEINGWGYALVDGKYGFMMMQYLTSSPVTQAPTWQPAGETTMYVQTNNGGRLHLRQAASSASISLGLYPNGTKVNVKARFGAWVMVTVDHKTGYMMLQYLTSVEPSPTAAPTAMPTGTQTMIVQTGNSGKLHLRQYPTSASSSLGLYPNGTKVTVLSVSGAWAQTAVDGKIGYMMLAFLSSGGMPPVTPEPGPSTPPIAGTMYVQTGNTGKLHLRQGPGSGYASLGLYPNGTKVTVTALLGTWARVLMDGKDGYMLLSCLTAVEPVITPVPPTAAPASPTTMYVKTGNTGKLYLRSGPSKATAVLGKYPNGTQVTMTGKTSAWANVTVDGKNGYMMLQYLTVNGPAPAPTSVPTPTPDPSKPTPTPAPTAIPGTATVRHPGNSYVYLRSTAHSSTSSNIIAKVPSGTVVNILQRNSTWSKVQYGSQTGYMLNAYLK